MSSGTSVWRRRLVLLAAAAVFAVGNLVFFLTYRSSSEVRRGALEARRDALKQSVHAREAEAARLVGQRDRLSGVSTAMEEFYGRRIGSQRETLAAIVSELHAVMREVGVFASQISYSTTPVKKVPLTQMKITFSMRCDYARFKRLLRSFEASRRWIAIRSISISRDEQPGSVAVQLELATYFSDRESVPPEKPARGAVPARRTS